MTTTKNFLFQIKINNLIRDYSTIKITKDTHPKKNWMHKSYNPPHSNFLLNIFSNDRFNEDFISSLRQDINYALLIIIISDQGEMKISSNKAVHDINYRTPKDYLSELVNNTVSNCVEEYQLTGILNITFRYREEVIPTPVNFIKPSKILKKSSFHLSRMENSNFKDLYVPFSFNEKDFGKFQGIEGNIEKYLYRDKYYIERKYSPIKDNDAYDIKVFYLNKLIYQCFDEKIDKGVFRRKIDNQELTIKNNKVIKYEKILNKLSTIKVLPYDNKPLDMNNFFTYDIEAYLDDNKCFTPFAAQWYTHNKTKVYYLTDYEDYQSMIIASFRDLLIKENNNVTVYIHNNRNFDGIYILNSILKTEDIHIKPFFNKGKMISITLTLNKGVKNKSVKIVLKDSLCLLPSSLRQLGKSYDVNTLKGVFPYDFVNKDNYKNYIGTNPSMDYYKLDDLVQLKYEELKKYYECGLLFDMDLIKKNKKVYLNLKDLKKFKANFPHLQYFDSHRLASFTYNDIYTNIWELKKETLLYLHDDCKSLYEILLKVRKMVYEDYHVDITTVCSNAALSFKIFRVNFFSQIPEDIKENSSNYSYKEWLKIQSDYTPKIVKLKRKDYKFITESYYGGLVDVFKPRVINGYYYDINAHYANQMLKGYYPVGDPIFSTDTNLDNYFGVVKAKVTVPKMDYPPLPYRTNHGVKNMWGTWTGIYVSEELKNIRDQYGCTIEVICGYTFKEKVKLFENFINHFNPIKEKFKGTAKGDIAKLTQNSLFGKFGMKLFTTITELLSQHQHDKLRKDFNVVDFKEMEGNMELVTYNNLPILDVENINFNESLSKYLKSEKRDESLDVNVTISSFISAYARIEYNRLKHLPNIGLIAGDTDSLITQNPLPPEEVGKELGKLKLEYEIKEGMHVSAKFYYHLTPDGLEHIKARGAGSDIKKEEFEELINLKSIKYNKEKWYRNLVDGYVEKRQIPLILKGGSLKRKLILKDGIWIDTESLNINEISNKNEIIIEEINSTGC